MKTLLAIAVILGAMITVPIGLYLQYQVLHRVNATELMWFLYYVNIPLIVLTQIILAVAKKG